MEKCNKIVKIIDSVSIFYYDKLKIVINVESFLDYFFICDIVFIVLLIILRGV